jgi:hypothetical protein
MKRSSPIVGGQRPPPGLRPSDAPCLEPAPATDVRAHLILALRTMFVAWSAKVGSVPVILLMGRPFTVAPGDDLCLRDRFGALAWADASRSICGRKWIDASQKGDAAMNDTSLKIYVVTIGAVAETGQEVQGIVSVRRSAPYEVMQISVVAPDEGNEARNKANLLAAAKLFARQFLNV